MIRSLRGRLFAGLTAMIVLTGAIAAIFAYKWAFDEAVEIQDSLLIELASLAGKGRLSSAEPLHPIEEEAEVWLIEQGKEPHSAEDRQLFGLNDGLQTARWKGESVRVMLRTRADGSRFAVAQPTAVRDDTARDVAFRTLLPIAALIPGLMLVTALVIAHSLRPMVRLAEHLDAKRADDLTALSLAGTPSELHPFISSINALLGRIRLLIDQQRRFVADAAHELRTPITALSLQAENLEQVELSEPARDRVAVLKQGMQRTKQLLEQLLALARQEATAADHREMPRVSLDSAVKQVVADLMPRALAGEIDLGFRAVEPLTVRAEPVMLAVIVRNLLDNALRFTPPGKSIDVGIYRHDHSAIVQIDDSGPGIAPSELQRVFEPFFRGSRPQGGGSGLGLSIVKRALETLGGSITLENVNGPARSGLSVRVCLPLAIDPARPPA
jgi:two-component system OmpR family sensor kinase